MDFLFNVPWKSFNIIEPCFNSSIVGVWKASEMSQCGRDPFKKGGMQVELTMSFKSFFFYKL